MKTASSIVAVATGLLAVASLANAADLPLKTSKNLAVVEAPRVASWNGLYLGVNLGYGIGQHATSESTVAGPGIGILPAGTPIYGNGQRFDLDPRGAVGGVQVGYNWHYTPSWLLGIEADIQSSGMKRTANCILACNTPTSIAPGLATLFPVTFNDNSASTKIDWFGTVRGRFGYVAGSTLFYATGGLAYADIERRGSVAARTDFILGGQINTFEGSFNNSTTKTGWTLGFGLEGMLSPNWTLKGEYLYMDFGSITDRFDTVFTSGLSTGQVAATRSVTSDVREHIARVGLNYKFGN